jgi:hypothetical protein
MTWRAISHRPYLVATPAALAHLSGDSLADFVAHNYTAPRVVLAASGRAVQLETRCNQS